MQPVPPPRPSPATFVALIGIALAIVAASVVQPIQAASRHQVDETPKVTAPVTEPPTEPPTAAATVPPPTAEPPTPTSLLPLPTTAPTRGPTREDESAPPTVPPDVTAPTPLVTRTRRATRTPRTTVTAVPTPLVAGALRLDVSVAPGAPIAGQPFTAYIDLLNQDEAAAASVTLDLSTSDVVRIEGAETLTGEAVAAGPLVRWYVPTLGPGGQARLTVSAFVMRSSARSLDLCVMIMSAGAPLQHCSVFAVGAPGGGAGEGATGGAFSSQGTLDPLALPTASPAGLLDVQMARPVFLGWLLVLLGLAVLGAWLGLQVRGRR